MPLSQTPSNITQDLSYLTATAIVNEIPGSLNFLDSLLFPRSTEEVLMTEDFEVIVVSDDRSMMPFIKPGTRAPASTGIDYTIGTYKTPMIAEARPMPIDELLLRRRPGTSHYAGSHMTTATRQHIAREFSKLRRHWENRNEWMAAELIKNRALTYSVDDQDSFTIEYPFEAATQFTLAAGGGWNELTYVSGSLDDESAAATDPQLAFNEAALLMNEHARVAPTVCLMGKNASLSFLNHPKTLAKLDARNLDTGSLTFMRQFDQGGARFLGTFVGGVQCWEYTGKLVLDSGSSDFLLDEDSAYWIHVGPLAEFQKVYGVIPNWKLSLGRRKPTTFAAFGNIRAVPARIFADVIADDHGNSLEGQMYSRPLPVLRRPNVIASATVIL